MRDFLDFSAAWSLEAWREAIGASAVALPVVDVERDVALCVIAGTVAALALMTLAGIRHLPARERWAVFGLLLPVLALPLAGLSGTRYGDMARAEAQRIGALLLHGPQPRAEATATPREAVPVEAAAEQPSNIAVAAPVAPVAVPVPEAQKPSAAQSAANALSRLASLATRKALPKSDVRVVPVLYGTDRAADRSGAMLEYSAARAGRLALGRVLVSVGQGDIRTISEVRELPPDEVAAAAKLEATSARRANGRALVYVHGLNTSFTAAVKEAVSIAEAAHFDGAVLVYSWPSASHVLQYGYDAESASGAVAHLADFLTFVAREAGAGSISVVADGLGAAAAVDALRSLAVLKQHGDALPAAFGEVMLRAPDMESGRFRAGVPYMLSLGGRVTLFAAASDRALNISRRYVGTEPRAGDVSAEGPLVIEGVETVDVSEAPFDPRRATAGPSPALAALGARLEGGSVAAGLFDEVRSAHGTYWLLKSHPVSAPGLH